MQNNFPCCSIVFFFLSASHTALLYRRAIEIHFYSFTITQKQHKDIGVKNRISSNIMCLHLQGFFFLLFAFGEVRNFSHGSLSSCLETEALVRTTESTHQNALLLWLRRSINSTKHTFLGETRIRFNWCDILPERKVEVTRGALRLIKKKMFQKTDATRKITQKRTSAEPRCCHH